MVASTSVTFDILARDRASSKFAAVADAADRSTSRMSKVGSVMASVAKYGGLAAVAAGGFAVKLGVDAVSAASDLNETLSKSNIIFGKHAGAMRSWAAGADESMGLSQQAALAAASGFGDMFSQIGFSGDQAAKMSKNVVQLSADLGSFNNLETADVAERMSAAFRGEYDSLQALIPNINAARVEQVAMARTGKKAADELTAQEKAAATLAIVTKDGARAQGDFARTSDGLANQTKILKAQLENASASFGQKLLPIAVEVAEFANDELVPAIEKGAEWLGDRLPGAIDKAVDAGKDIAKALAPVVEEGVEAFKNLADEGDTVGRVFNNVFLPALSTTADIVAGLIDFVDDLPGPVKEFGIEAAVAAAGISKLNSAMIATKESTFITTMMDAESRTNALKSAAKTAAGVGGILALTSALQDAGDEGASFGDVLKGAAGGAGVGAMFGPIGALVGAGVGGGLTALRGAFADTKDEAREARIELLRTEGFENAKEDAASLRDALSGVVHQYGKVTRAAVESSFTGKDGKLDADVQTLRDLGVSMDTIVSASLGQRDAIQIVNSAMGDYRGTLETTLANAESRWNDVKDGIGSVVTATGEVEQRRLPTEQVELYEQEWKDAKAALEEFNNTQDVFDERVNKNTGALEDHRDQMRSLAKDLQIPLKLYEEWPAEVRSRFEAQGLVQTSADAIKLIGQYKGLQKFDRIKAVISAPGVDLTATQVKKLQDRYGLTPEQVVTLMKTEGLPTTIRDIARAVSEHKKVDNKTLKTLIDLSGVDTTVNEIRRVESEMRDLNGDTAHTYIVTHHTTRREGNDTAGGAPDLRNGRSTRPGTGSPLDNFGVAGELGRVLMARGGGGFKGIGAGIVRALLAGLNSGNANKADDAIERMMKAIKKAVDDKKITEAAAARMRKTIRAMEQEAAKGRAAIMKRLEFANSLKESFKNELDLGSIIESEDFAGIGSITGGTQSLAARLQAFAVQLKELRKEGMPKGLIAEIASLGSVKGSEAAAAILSASDSEQRALSQAFNAYQQAANSASNAAANAVHGTVRDIKNEYHVEINIHGGNPKENAKEIEQALIRLSRIENRRLLQGAV